MRRCLALLETSSWEDEPDLLLYLAGEHGRRFVERGPGREGYRLRVWPLRAIAAVGEGEHMAPVRELLADQDPELAALAEVTLARMGGRLERPIG